VDPFFRQVSVDHLSYRLEFISFMFCLLDEDLENALVSMAYIYEMRLH
jgi:hypothetical protein